MRHPAAVSILFATQNLNAVLKVMQWGVIALIFLFFLRVIRAVWVEMRPDTVAQDAVREASERRQEKATATRPVRAGRGASRCTCGSSNPQSTRGRPSTSTTS